MQKLIVIEDISDPQSWEYIDTENIVDYLIERYITMPPNGRLYKNDISQLTDITPHCESDIERVLNCEDVVYFVIFPSDPLDIILVVVLLAVVSAAIFFKPKIPSISSSSNRTAKSPNNDLGNRTNQVRVNGRIPDIFGTVVSTPDMIITPRIVYNNNNQYEVAHYCIGRGAYNFGNTPFDIKDGDTNVNLIEGMMVVVWPPNYCINNDYGLTNSSFVIGSTDISIDKSFAATWYRSNSVDGVDLISTELSWFDVGLATVTSTGVFTATEPPVDFTTKFTVGNSISLSFYDSTPTFHEGVGCIVSEVGTDYIKISNPEVITGWGTMTFPNDISFLGFLKSGESIGPYIINTECEYLQLNFVAENGLYKDDGDTVTPFPITIGISIQAISSTGVDVGTPISFQVTISGSTSDDIYRALTVNQTVTKSRYKLTIVRITPTDKIFEGNVIDVVKLRDVYYGINEMTTDQHFGNVTTAMTIQKANTKATTVKERKLNCKVTRIVRDRNNNNVASNNIADILSHVCRDTFIGNRPDPQIDFDSFYDTATELASYFGHNNAREFCYTFDEENITFEETVNIMSQSCFCIGYRRGNQIKLSFEKTKETATLLFNHRNKIPGSETRTVNFGYVNDNDGIEFQYINPDTNLPETLYYPVDKTAVNAKKIEIPGVRNGLQAYLHANRYWNKAKYQHCVTEFEATQESHMLLLNDKILVADGTRADVQDGEVMAQNGLELTLSQPVDLGTVNTIFLQYYDGTVQGIGCSAGSDGYKVVLNSAPAYPLVTDSKMFAKTTYIITVGTQTRTDEFLTIEKSISDNYKARIKAVNYDSRYYGNDKDYINGIVNEKGMII